MSDPASALEIFLDELARRVALMVSAGAVEDLITASPSTQTSLNTLIDLVDRYTALDRSGR